MERIYRQGFKYKKAGVMLNHLVPAEQLSIRLYGNERFKRSRRVMKAVDEINRRYGHDTIRYGVIQPTARWQTKALRRSQRYTTRLQEVLSI